MTPPAASPLVLGTAQLGGAYGVANTTGPPDAAHARDMIAEAVAGGITTFDTAAAYGASEQVLGRALGELGACERVVIATKVRPLTPEERRDPGLARVAIEDSVRRSRERLGVERIPVVLFHREEDAVHLPVLGRLRDDGLIGRIGVSLGNEPPAGAALDGVDAVQLPFNVLDRRHASTIAAAADVGVAVYVRSVFLQGLILMPEEAIHPLLGDAIAPRRALAGLAAEAGLSMAELAVRYVLAQTGDVRVIVGAETPAQVRANVGLAGAGPLEPDLVLSVENAVGPLPEFVVTPSRWVGAVPPGWTAGRR